MMKVEKTNKVVVPSDYEIIPASAPENIEINWYVKQPVAKRHTYFHHGQGCTISNNYEMVNKSYHSREQVQPDYSFEGSYTIHLIKREFSRTSCREGLWKRAVKNLYKRINFLELNIDFLNDYISEDEFEKALTTREDEYVISFSDIKNALEAEAIYDIIRALGKSFDVHEVAELFGVEAKSLYNMQAKSNLRSSELLELGH